MPTKYSTLPTNTPVLNRQFPTLNDPMESAVIRSNLDGTILAWDQAAERLYGYTKKEVIGGNIAIIVPPHRRPELHKIFSRLQQGKKIENFSTERVNKNGELIKVILNLNPILSKNQIIGVTSLDSNTVPAQTADELKNRLVQQALISELSITALSGIDLPAFLKLVTEKLAHTLKTDYSKLLECLPHNRGFILKAGYGWGDGVRVNEVMVRPALSSQAGYTLQVNQPVIVADSDKEERFKIPALFKRHGIKSGMSVVIHGKKQPYGVLGVYTKTKRLFTTDDTNFLQAVASLVGLTIERYEANRELENIRYALDQSAIVAITDKAGRIEYVNQMFADISKYSRDELIGKTHRVVNSGFHSPEFFNEFWQTIQSGKVWRGEIRNRTKDGQYYWVDTTVTPLLDEHGVPERYISIRKDITERKRLEQQKDEFIAMASHELKTPLTSLKAYGQILTRSMATHSDNLPGIDMLTKMDLQINKITDLINELLDISKIEANKLELKKSAFDFDDLVRDMIEEIKLVFPKRQIDCSLNAPVTLYADRDRLNQVLINLLNNAIKYSPASTRVKVITGRTLKQVKFTVADRGIGIKPEEQQLIFDRFYRAGEINKQTYGGLGLGLYISAEIIRQHHGKIWVHSTPGQGSQFNFTLPVIPAVSTPVKQ